MDFKKRYSVELMTRKHLFVYLFVYFHGFKGPPKSWALLYIIYTVNSKQITNTELMKIYRAMNTKEGKEINYI